MHLFAEILCFSSLALGIASGLHALHWNRDFFFEFDIHHIVELRLDVVLYFAVIFSTGLCTIDASIWTTYILADGMTNMSIQWHSLWIIVHAGFAISSTGVHVLVNRLLKSNEVCAFCKRTR